MTINSNHVTQSPESFVSSMAPVMPLKRVWSWWVLALSLVTPLVGFAEEEQQQPPVQHLLVEMAVAMAINNNPSLSEIQSRYEAMSEIPSQLGTLPDPVFSMNALNLPTDTFNVGQEGMTQMQIGLSQVMPFPGKLALQEGASKFEAMAAGNSVDEMRLRLISNTKSSWWQLYYLDRALDVVASNQDLLRQFIQVADKKYEVGKGLQQDTLLAQLELSKLFDQEIRLQAIRRNQAIQLNTLMDVSPEAEIVLPAKVSTVMPNLISEVLLYERAENVRPLLREKKNHIKAAQSRLKLARKEYYPDFKLGLTYGNRSGDNPFPRGGERSDFLSVMVSVNLPIYHKRKLDRAVDQRNMELRKSRNSLQDKWTMVRSEISSASTDYLESKKLFSLFQDGIIPQSRQTVASMLAGYQVNEVDFLNLVGSQVTLLNYEVQYWKSLTDAKRALARLVAAVGEEKISE